MKSINLSTQIILRLFKITFKVNKRLFFINWMALILNAIAPILSTLLFAIVLNNLTSNNANINDVIIFIFMFALLNYMEAATWEVHATINFILLKYDLTYYFTDEIFKKVSTLDIEFFENPKFSELKSKALDGFEWRPTDMIGNTFTSIRQSIRAIAAGISIIYISPFAALIIGLSILPGMLVDAKFRTGIWGLWGSDADTRRKYGTLMDINENYRYVKELRLLGISNYFRERLLKMMLGVYKRERKIQNKRAYAILVTKFLPVASASIFVAFLAKDVIDGKSQIGSLTFFAGSLMAFQGAFGSALFEWNKVFDNTKYLSLIFEFLDIPRKIVSKPDAIKKIDVPQSIEFENVSFKYPDTKKYILKNLSLKINSGEKIAIVGENGSGKSTMIKLILRFYEPTDGRILINGTDLRDIDLETWRKSCATLLQDFSTFSLPSVGENIGFGNLDSFLAEAKLLNESTDTFEYKMPKDLINASKKARAEDAILKTPKGYNELIGRDFGGSDFSGGEHQRIALARTFYKNAGTIIMDEPTSAVDAKAEAEIFESIKEHLENKTVIFVSHRFSTVRIADRILVVENGVIIEDGDHEKLLKKDGLYAKMFKLQAKGYK